MECVAEIQLSKTAHKTTRSTSSCMGSKSSRLSPCFYVQHATKAGEKEAGTSLVRASRSHLQSLIACSMQIWRGKAWGIWSRVISGRQRVDTWTGGHHTGIIMAGHHPRVPTLCLPDVTTRYQSPRPSPSVFALSFFMYCKQSNTGGGNRLGMGYDVSSFNIATIFISAS